MKKLHEKLQEELIPFYNVDPGATGDIVALVTRIIREAVSALASDVHFEPSRGATAVRFRMDGVLTAVASLPREFHPAVIARLKLLANLRVDEYRRPQDGRIELEELPNVSLRLSTAPALYGEKAVVRVLNDLNRVRSVRELGLTRPQAEIIRRNIERPYGMIITSGPTGSGKTTTLYAMLNLLKKDGINITTLENPIEYPLDGVNQMQVETRFDFTFANGLRAILRQDPDVLMVGEIRDSETAVMAANAALTGHLVLTSIHTNDAPSVLTRFLEMKVDDFVAASTISLVIAQRLVRKICNYCAGEEKLDAVMIEKIRERPDVLSALKHAGVGLHEIRKNRYRVGRGCRRCLLTGYAGRVGTFELLEVTREIRNLILGGATADSIRIAANKPGFREMVFDGIQKVFAGKTTFEEVLRTTRNS